MSPFYYLFSSTFDLTQQHSFMEYIIYLWNKLPHNLLSTISTKSSINIFIQTNLIFNACLYIILIFINIY